MDRSCPKDSENNHMYIGQTDRHRYKGVPAKIYPRFNPSLLKTFSIYPRFTQNKAIFGNLPSKNLW